MERKIVKVGNSVHLSIPDAIKKKLKLVRGQMLSIVEENGQIIIEPVPLPTKEQVQESKFIPKGMIDNDT